MARQILPARDLVFIGEWPSPPADYERCSVGPVLNDVGQKLPASVPGFAGERPSPPISMNANLIGTSLTFQGYQKYSASGSGCSTLFVSSPGLTEAQAKGTDLQIVPGELSLAVNLESLDDALCSVLMRSQLGEDEAWLAVQPLNVVYPCAENELEFPDYVIKCAERIHSRVGVTYIGHKWQFMALLTFIEKERLKEVEAQSLCQ